MDCERLPILLATSIVYSYFCAELVESSSENIFNFGQDNHRTYCLIFLNLLGLGGFLIGSFDSYNFWSEPPQFSNPGISLGGFWVILYSFSYLDSVSSLVKVFVSGGVLYWLVRMTNNQTKVLQVQKSN